MVTGKIFQYPQEGAWRGSSSFAFHGNFFHIGDALQGVYSEDFHCMFVYATTLLPDNDLLSISLRLPFKGYIKDLLSIYEGYAGQDSHW